MIFILPRKMILEILNLLLPSSSIPAPNKFSNDDPAAFSKDVLFHEYTDCTRNHTHINQWWFLELFLMILKLIIRSRCSITQFCLKSTFITPPTSVVSPNIFLCFIALSDLVFSYFLLTMLTSVTVTHFLLSSISLLYCLLSHFSKWQAYFHHC